MTATRTKRLSRAESRQRTRAMIIEAATRLFLRQGFRATSLEQVAEVAGFTIGAVYSNFDGKTAVGIAVIDELYARAGQQLAGALSSATPADRGRLFEILSKWAEEAIGDPDWMRLETEIAAFSADDPAHRAATAARYERLRAWCRDELDRDSALDRDTLAIAIVGLALGIGAQRATDPSVPSAAWSDALRVLIGGE
jgi:AcrR family transcriptional regulator